jgi:hypothetical protein
VLQRARHQRQSYCICLLRRPDACVREHSHHRKQSRSAPNRSWTKRIAAMMTRIVEPIPSQKLTRTVATTLFATTGFGVIAT